PDTDPAPAGLVARLERLERLAQLDPTAVVPTVADVDHAAGPVSPADDRAPVEAVEPPVVEEAPPAAAPPVDPAPSEPEPQKPAPPKSAQSPQSSQQMPVPMAADAGNIDVAMLRRSWPQLIDHLANNRQMILKAILESATVASYDGTTIELAFPPDRKVGPQKVEEKQEDLRSALGDLFGIKPRVLCVVREFREPAGEPPIVEIVDEADVPDDAEALRRVQEMLGAQPLDEDKDDEKDEG
ncbi:MAG: hypothetical protein ACHQY1_04335, partial [Myxococcota bacterium]